MSKSNPSIRHQVNQVLDPMLLNKEQVEAYKAEHQVESVKKALRPHGDPTAGLHGAFAVLAALWYRHRTGQGQFIDLSAVETLTSLVGDSLFAYSVTGEVPQADENFHPEMAPHGAYPCTGMDWVSIAVADEGEWQALCGVLDADDLAVDAKTRTARLRDARFFFFSYAQSLLSPYGLHVG